MMSSPSSSASSSPAIVGKKKQEEPPLPSESVIQAKAADWVEMMTQFYSNVDEAVTSGEYFSYTSVAGYMQMMSVLIYVMWRTVQLPSFETVAGSFSMDLNVKLANLRTRLMCSVRVYPMGVIQQYPLPEFGETFSNVSKHISSAYNMVTQASSTKERFDEAEKIYADQASTERWAIWLHREAIDCAQTEHVSTKRLLDLFTVNNRLCFFMHFVKQKLVCCDDHHSLKKYEDMEDLSL